MERRSPLVENLMGEARRAALTSGLMRILRMHVQVGPDAGLTGDQVQAKLRSRFQGPLFEGCEVTWEEAEAGELVLASIEGIES